MPAARGDAAEAARADSACRAVDQDAAENRAAPPGAGAASPVRPRGDALSGQLGVIESGNILLGDSPCLLRQRIGELSLGQCNLRICLARGDRLVKVPPCLRQFGPRGNPNPAAAGRDEILCRRHGTARDQHRFVQHRDGPLAAGVLCAHASEHSVESGVGLLQVAQRDERVESTRRQVGADVAADGLRPGHQRAAFLVGRTGQERGRLGDLGIDLAQRGRHG